MTQIFYDFRGFDFVFLVMRKCKSVSHFFMFLLGYQILSVCLKISFQQKLKSIFVQEQIAYICNAWNLKFCKQKSVPNG